MRIEQLEYLAAVTQHGSLRRAGEQLHLSQPALSEALTKLEKELRVSLLDRRRSGTRISQEGRDLLPHMLEVLAAVERLRAAARDQRTGTRSIRVGAVHVMPSALLVPAVRSFREEHPSTTVDVVTLQQDRIDAGLVDGTLDFGLVNVLEGDSPPAGVRVVDLVRGRPVVVLPADHRLARSAEVTTQELRDEPFVMMRPSHLHRYLQRAFGTELPPAAHTTDGAEMAKALVAEGLGVTVMPDYAVVGDSLHCAGQIAVRPVAGDLARVTLQLRERKAVDQPLAVRELVRALRARAARESGPAGALVGIG